MDAITVAGVVDYGIGIGIVNVDAIPVVVADVVD